MANNEAIFGPGFDEDSLEIDFQSELFQSDMTESVQHHDPPRDDFIAELCLKSSLLTSNSSVNEAWQSVLCPLMVGPAESRPHLHQLLTNFSKYLIDRSNNIYESERRRQTLEHERVVEQRRAVIKAHNEIIPDDAVRLCMDHLHLLKSQSEITKFVRKFLELMHKRALTPHIEYLAVSAEICNALKESVNDQFAYVTVRWGLASADLAPVIDGFIAMARLALEYRVSNRKLSLNMLVPSLPSISLANGCFIPSQDGVIGSVDMDRVELSVTPCSSSLFSDGRTLFILGRRAALTTISVSHIGRSKTERITTRSLGIGGKARMNFAVTGGNGYLVVFGKLLSREIIYRLDPFEMIEEAVTYQSESLFGTPKLKIPVTSDGYYFYSLDSVRRVGVFSIEQPPVIRFHRFVEFQEGTSPLLPPYDKCLVPKEWVSHAATYTNGIVYSFLVLRRSDHNVFSYFTRHFSLIDGVHIADIVFPLKWPVLTLTIDPWNDCFWAISPNQERTNVVKLALSCSTSPWFVGTSMSAVPSMKDLVASFDESGSLDTTAVAINNYLTFYSAFFFGSSFRNVKINPQYRASTAFTFAACTQHAIDSLLDGICFFQNALSNLRKSFWSVQRLHSAMISLVKLLQYNLQNIELRIDQDGRSVVTLYSPMKVVDVLVNVLRDKKVQFIHRLCAYTLLKSSPVLFCDDKSLCPVVFSAIHATVGMDLIYWSTQTMNRQAFFAYSLSPEECETFCSPILQSMCTDVDKRSMSIEWIFSFQNALIREVHNSLKSGSSSNRDDEVLHAVFVNYCVVLMRQCAAYMSKFKQYPGQRLENYPIYKLLNNWMILMHPIMKYSRAASHLISHFQELFTSLLGNINSWKLDQPINTTKGSFHTIFHLFYHVYVLYLEGISTLLDGGCELSDTKRYAWLVKSTITSGVLDKDIVALMKTMFTEGGDDESQVLFEQGLSFHLKGPMPNGLVRDGKLLKDCVAVDPPMYVTNLFKYIYDSVSNRFTRRLTQDDMHFERVVFSALMKQLGFVYEMSHIVRALEAGEKPTLAPYMRQTMTTVYRIRGVMHMSRQATRQLQERAESEPLSRPSAPESLKGNYLAYRSEVLKKCVYLLHIQPCLRFSNQDFEQGFTDYLKRLELFLVSETPLKDYLELIASSEEAKGYVSHGLELIKGLVTSKMRVECRGVAIDKLASHDHFLTFLLGLSGEYLDEMTSTCLKTMSSLLRSLSDNLFPIECVSSQIVFFLNLVLVMAKMKMPRIFRPLLKLWAKLNEIKPSLTSRQWLSYRAFVVSAIHIVYCQDPSVAQEERFQQLITAIIPMEKLNETDLAVMRFGMRMNIVIPSCCPRNLITLLLKTTPRYYHSVCELLSDAVIRYEGDVSEILLTLLNFISQIAGGGHTRLLNGADSYASADFGDRSTTSCQTPMILLHGCSEVIQVVRQLFDSVKGEELRMAINKVIDNAASTHKGNECRSFDIWNDPTLLFGVFSVMSNTIRTIAVNTLAMNRESNTMFYITDIDELNQQVMGWNLPITPQSSKQTLMRGKRLTPIPAIPFSSEMFPATEGLVTLFMNHLAQAQEGFTEAVSFYILSSLKEYIKNNSFTQMLIRKITASAMAKDMGLTQIALGNSDSEFLEILNAHLRVAEGGFVNPVMGPKNGFMLASPADCIPCNFEAGKSFLRSTYGVAYFVSSLLDIHNSSTLVITPEVDARFDVGVFTLARHPSGSRTLGVFAHDDEVSIVGLHKRSVKQTVKSVELEFVPTKKQASLSIETDVEVHKTKVYFPNQQALFFVTLYKKSEVQYVMNNGLNTGNSSSLSLQNVRRVQLVEPSKEVPDDVEMYRFSISDIPLIDYPKSVIRRIEPSLQTVTRTLEPIEPAKTMAVSFNDMSSVGFKIPRGVLFVSNDRNGLISKVVSVNGVPFVHRYSGNVDKKREFQFKDIEYLQPMHFTTFPIVPPTILNHYASLVVSKLRKEALLQLFLHRMTGPSASFESTLQQICPSTSLMIQLLLSLLLYIEPINPMNVQNGNSPIDFWYRAYDSDLSAKQAHTVHKVVFRRLSDYLGSDNLLVNVTNKWLQLLDGMFNYGYSHSVQNGHPTAVVIPFCDLVTPVSIFNKHASSWFVFQSGFAGSGVSNAVIVTENDTEIPLSDNVVCVKGSRFRACVKSRFSQRSLVALPFIRRRNELLFGTVFDLLIALKYFVVFVKTHESAYDMKFLQQIKHKVYSSFFDALMARSPFFVTFGGEILQFLQHNMPITTNDMTMEFIQKLSLLSIYSMKDGMEYITQFIEEQQNVLDEVYVFGGQDFFNDLFVPSKEAGDNSNPTMKLFNDPFPNVINDKDKRGKVLGNLKRVLMKRKDVHSCPFHLLLHRWAQYSLLCPAVEVTVLNRNVCRVKFQFYVPKTFNVMFTTVPSTIRLQVSDNSHFRHPRYLTPDSPIQTNGKSEIFIQILDDEAVTFHNLSFYIRSDNVIPLENFVRDYRTQFVLDAKTFFIHWDNRVDQAILKCFPVKQYMKSSLVLDFDPGALARSKFAQPMSLLCCRYFFLMILNYYYAHESSIFSKDATLNACLDSISIRLKHDRLRHMVAKSNGVESDYIRVNRKNAFEVRDGQSKKLTNTLMSQLTQLYKSPAQFRVSGDKPWRVHLIGEHGCDVGGLARELVVEAAADLMCPLCGLVVPIPDSREDEDSPSLMIPIPNERHRDPLRQYRFAGALIAIAIRSGLSQDFNFAPLVWQYLLTQRITIESIYSIDHNFHSLITSLKQAMDSGAPDDAIRRFNLKFVIQDSAGRETLLTPNGMDECVTIHNCERFIALATEFRLNEMKNYLNAMSSGLWENFAMKPPRSIDWTTLEYAACGEKEISTELLKQVTTFDDVPEDQQDIFWRVIERFTNDQRSLLLKFVTGRVKLPLRSKPSKMLKVDASFGHVDKMPTASTCFNQLHLPRYTSFERARKMIALAIEYTGTFEMG